MKTISVDRTASKGIVIGKAYVVKKESIVVSSTVISEGELEKEIKRYQAAVDKAKADLTELAKKSDIFAAHYEVAQDIALMDGVIDKIKEQKMNAEMALVETSAGFVAMFEAMDDEYMRERAADMKDVTNRLLRALKGIEDNALSGIKEKVIVVAEDLTPSDTSCLDLNYVLGFITQEGGVTSHVSIMARNLNLPALVGVSNILSEVKSKDELILDAGQGIIMIHPDQETLTRYEKLSKEYQEKQEELLKLSELPSVTLDGKQVELCANVGNLEDIKNALNYHMDGVGLFRSEFLYMESSHFPTEEEQYEVYKQAAQLLQGKEIIVRTLDIGGDKELKYFEFEKEENPFLGYRAIRICLDKEEVFKAQLRALLRASAYGNVKIMYPMIISVEELEGANKLLEICKEELKAEGIPYDVGIAVGMMIETPASVVCAEDFAKLVDFFSIGTNDLTQYTLAVDRGNKKISHMYNSFHPAVLRSIKKVIDAGHNNKIKVGMCGEFASDPKALKLLLGMGLDEFSMSAGAIAEVKYELRRTEYQKAKEMAEQALKLTKIDEINKLLEKL